MKIKMCCGESASPIRGGTRPEREEPLVRHQRAGVAKAELWGERFRAQVTESTLPDSHSLTSVYEVADSSVSKTPRLRSACRP
jgi:hypothetical protein